MSQLINRLFQPLFAHHSYMMPTHFGPRPLERATGIYHDVTSMIVTYRTDHKKLTAYVPEPFRLADDPLVIVSYAMNRGIDWLAGRSYNLIQVMTPAVFEGQVDRLEGYFSLVLWENLCDPILTGRELQGMPKIFANIPDHTITQGEWHTSANHFDHEILDMTIDGLRELTTEEIAAEKKTRAGKDHWMGWRFIPELGEKGTALSQPTVFPIEQNTDRAWVGAGKVSWQTLTWQQNPTQCHIVNALASLPVIEYLPASVTHGSTNLYLPNNLPRVLR